MTPTASALQSFFARSEPSEEARWVREARTGSAEAVLRLLERYRPPLVRLLTGVTGDAALAEDLAQETLLHAFRSLSQLRDPARFYPWVRRMGVRRAVRAAQQAAGRPLSVPLEERYDLAEPGDALRAVETRLVVQELLERLSPELRAALVLREVEQLEYAEIAETLEIPVGTVRSRLFAAREKFRMLWAELDGPVPGE